MINCRMEREYLVALSIPVIIYLFGCVSFVFQILNLKRSFQWREVKKRAVFLVAIVLILSLVSVFDVFFVLFCVNFLGHFHLN